MKNLKEEIEGTVEKICEELFLHGKYTPDKSYALPEGQITIVEAIDALTSLIEQEKERVELEALDRLCDWYIGQGFRENEVKEFKRRYSQYLAERKEE